jgi:hypothetical protein
MRETALEFWAYPPPCLLIGLRGENVSRNGFGTSSSFGRQQGQEHGKSSEAGPKSARAKRTDMEAIQVDGIR